MPDLVALIDLWGADPLHNEPNLLVVATLGVDRVDHAIACPQLLKIDAREDLGSRAKRFENICLDV